MAVETTEALDAKAHALIGQLAPQKLAAVVRLLEVMVDDEDDDDFLYPEENVRRFRESQAASSPGASMEGVLADFGLTQADFPLKK
jgi:hypothetical protein